MFNLKNAKMGEILNGALTPEKRVVVYHGVATIASNVIIGLITKDEKTVAGFKGKAPLVVRQIAFMFNEMGVVDVPLLSGIIQTHIDFRTKTLVEDEDLGALIYQTGCFEDTLKITTYFSKATIELINSNYQAFKDAMTETRNVSKDIISVLNNND